jgi:MraZ protein
MEAVAADVYGPVRQRTDLGTGDEAMTFLGQYSRTVDDKGRLVIPGEFRRGLGAGAMMTRSFDSCICIYPKSKWEVLAGAVRDLPQVRSDVRDLARSVFGGATKCSLDAQGRIAVPAYLREFANLRGEAVILGVNGHLEIWSKDLWLRKQLNAEASESVFLEVLSASGA